MNVSANARAADSGGHAALTVALDAPTGTVHSTFTDVALAPRSSISVTGYASLLRFAAEDTEIAVRNGYGRSGLSIDNSAFTGTRIVVEGCAFSNQQPWPDAQFVSVTETT